MAQDSALTAFKDWFLSEYRANAGFEAIQVLDDPAQVHGNLELRLCVVNRSYYQVRVCLEEAQVQVGFGTESRMVNESIEQMVLDNGGDLSELLADELCDLGGDPLAMEHFFERPAFRFIVRLPFENLEDPALRATVQRVLKASHVLFQDCVDEA